jgi:hypothetical protein
MERLVGWPVREPSRRRVLVLVAALLVTMTSPALAQDRATYGARPAPGEGDRSSGSFFLSVGTGSTTSDAVEIINLAGEPASFDVYAVGVARGSRGERLAASRDAVRTMGPASWIAVEPAVVEVPPRSSALVPFTVAVPDNTPLGEHMAALMVEPRQPADSGTIVSKSRVGLWVEITVLDGRGVAPDPTVPGGPMSQSWALLVALTVALILCAGVLLFVTRDRLRRALAGWRERRRGAGADPHEHG